MNKLIEKIFVKGTIKLISPIAIGNGVNDNTDNDIILDSDGKVFIPGTSLAGSIRNYLNTIYKENEEMLKVINEFFGQTDSDNGYQSSIYFYDSFLIKEGSVTVRDGIQIDEFLKVTKHNHKYDYEVVERDNSFQFKIEVIIRESQKSMINEIYKIIETIIYGFDNKLIKIGSKRNRGLGEVTLKDTQCLDFKLTDKFKLEELYKFNWNSNFKDICPIAFDEGEKIIKISDESEFNTLKESIITEISFPISLKDTLLIRNYNLLNSDVDVEQLMFNKKAIIPGTSLGGAFRNKVFMLLYELTNDEEKARSYVKNLFGTDEKDDGISSKVAFNELMDSKVTKLCDLRRTKIDRFTGGACNSGLFEERVAVGCEFNVSISIKNTATIESDLAVILLVIYDLFGGYFALGGECSVGRGIFVNEVNGKINKDVILINGEKLTEEVERKYMNSLKNELN